MIVHDVHELNNREGYAYMIKYSLVLPLSGHFNVMFKRSIFCSFYSCSTYLCVLKRSLSPGTVDFNLSAMPLPAKKADNCSLAQLPRDGATGVRTDNLFNRRRMKGWWPVYDVKQEGIQQLKV